MNRDDMLKQVVVEFGFDLDEMIRIGGKYMFVLVDGSMVYIVGQVLCIGEVVYFVGVVGEFVLLDDGCCVVGILVLCVLLLICKYCGMFDVIVMVLCMIVYVCSVFGFMM